MNTQPEQSNVTSFLSKRAERAYERYRRLDWAERTEAEIENLINALLDYSHENTPKGTASKPYDPTPEESAESLRRMREITGPLQPLPPEQEALVQFAACHTKEFIEWAERDGGAS